LRVGRFKSRRLQGKARRIGANRARLQAKAGQWERLTVGLPEGDPRQAGLEMRRARTQVELAYLAAAQTHLNEQIARLAARWSRPWLLGARPSPWRI
jgi:hypothetical protein